MALHRVLLYKPLSAGFLGLSALFLTTVAPTAPDQGDGVQLEEASIFFEYNATDIDLVVQVSLDGEDWNKLKIINPNHKTIFEVAGKGPYKELGLTELFFEGAEPTLDEVSVDELLAMFPAGEYDFQGKTVDGEDIEGEGELSHAIPNAPDVSTQVGPGNTLIISWVAVPGTPVGFPDLPVELVSFQIIVEDEFQVMLPATATSVTVSPEFVASLDSGVHHFEVLAYEASGNHSITESTFVKP